MDENKKLGFANYGGVRVCLDKVVAYQSSNETGTLVTFILFDNGQRVAVAGDVTTDLDSIFGL